MKRIVSLDGLKGIAALIVVLHHFSLAFYPAIYTRALGEVHTGWRWEFIIYNTPLGWLLNGNNALVLFLILSGFSLSYKYFLTHDKTVLTDTALKRYFRLMPPIAASIILAFIIIVLGGNFAHQASRLTGSWWWLGQAWTVTPNLWLMLKQAFFDVFIRTIPAPESYNSSLWVIPIFFLGTFLVTGMLSLVGERRVRWLVYGILALLLINTYYLSLIVGVGLCDWLVNRPAKSRVQTSPALVLLLMLVALYLGSYPTEHSAGQLTGTIYALLPQDMEVNSVILYHTLGSLSLVLAIILSQRLQRWLSTPLFQKLGSISFSLFAFHAVILVSLGSFLFTLFSPLTTYSMAFAGMFSLTILTIITLAVISRRFIEPAGSLLAKRVLRLP